MRDYKQRELSSRSLVARYGHAQARDALQSSHRDVFRKLCPYSLEKLGDRTRSYVRASHEAPHWSDSCLQELEPYRVAVPMEADSSMVQLFLSNIRLALEVLRLSAGTGSGGPTQPSSPQPLLEPMISASLRVQAADAAG